VRLYSYYRSSAAYRLRIALNLKGLAYDYAAVNLLQGEQKSAAYLDINPAGLVPSLELDDHSVLTQSVAILEWLEETHAQPPLLPRDALARARVRAMVNLIACDIHPICNVGVVNHLKSQLQADEAAVRNWFTTWMQRGFRAIEQFVASSDGPYCAGDAPTLADVCLVPQVYNARRFDIPLQAFPRIVDITAHCLGLDAFAAAAPEQQPDYPG
jgi:maleylacetoacetate isomerase